MSLLKGIRSTVSSIYPIFNGKPESYLVCSLSLRGETINVLGNHNPKTIDPGKNYEISVEKTDYDRLRGLLGMGGLTSVLSSERKIRDCNGTMCFSVSGFEYRELAKFEKFLNEKNGKKEQKSGPPTPIYKNGGWRPPKEMRNAWNYVARKRKNFPRFGTGKKFENA
ncbi:MAG: hypothetical protein GTN40_03915 [Candidatus Aenigmarchaeota archaeon]|nr:hypothetical protein [Candidatus Aenigmarchaeota archaeon]